MERVVVEIGSTPVPYALLVIAHLVKLHGSYPKLIFPPSRSCSFLLVNMPAPEQIRDGEACSAELSDHLPFLRRTLETKHTHTKKPHTFVSRSVPEFRMQEN